jgi:hypothetical protein
MPTAMHAQIRSTLTLVAHVHAQSGRVVVDHGSALQATHLEGVYRRKAVAVSLEEWEPVQKAAAIMLLSSERGSSVLQRQHYEGPSGDRAL